MILTFTSDSTRESPQPASADAPLSGKGAGTPPAARFGVAAGHASYKWWALSCTSLGMLLAATNSGTLIIALPDLERSLHTSLLALVWVILAYLIAATVLVLMAGRLSATCSGASAPTSAASSCSRSRRSAPASRAMPPC